MSIWPLVSWNCRAAGNEADVIGEKGVWSALDRDDQELHRWDDDEGEAQDAAAEEDQPAEAAEPVVGFVVAAANSMEPPTGRFAPRNGNQPTLQRPSGPSESRSARCD